MHRTLSRCARGWLPFSKKGADVASGETAKKEMTLEQREKLRSLKSSLVVDGEKNAQDSVRIRGTVGNEMEGFMDEDAIRARGVAKYAYTYTPPANIESIVKGAAEEILSLEGTKVNSVKGYSFKNKCDIKFKILMAVSSRLESTHLPVNGKLVYLNTVQDIIDFYSNAVDNTNDYVRLARDETKPSNVTIMERAARFHPEDIEAAHGGITAFPGEGGEVMGERNKRLYRQFKPKEKWFDYEDQSFDYTRVDAKMPWDPEMIARMDSFADKRYNLSTRKFTRTNSTRLETPQH